MWRSYTLLWSLFDRRGRSRMAGLLALMVTAALIEAFAVASLLPFLSGLGKRASTALPVTSVLPVNAAGSLDVVIGMAVLFSLAVVAAIALKALADYASMAFSSMQCARWSRQLLLVHLNRDYDWFLGRHSAELGYGLLERVQEVVNAS